MLEKVSSEHVSRAGGLGRSIEIIEKNDECRKNGHPNSEKTYYVPKTNRVRMKCRDCGAIHYRKPTAKELNVDIYA